jgi:hypothetical protein
MCVLKKLWEKIIRSPLLEKQSCARKLATLGIATAFSVIANTLCEFKLMDTQYSLTIAVSAFIGILLGGGFGFIVSFLGDLIGFLINASGFAYMPWIGIALGLAAMLTGFIVNGIRKEGRLWLAIKLALSCVLTFLACTVAVNTTAFWLLYAPKVEYFTYLASRLFVQGQIYNSLVNYALFCIAVPALARVKALKITL